MMQFMVLDGYNPNALNGSDFNIITFNIKEPTVNPVITIPASLVEVTPYPEETADTSRSLIFTPEQMGPNQLNGKFLINGTTFNMDVINFTIPLNNTEIWVIKNQSAIAHPFHIHDVQFYVLDRNGNPPPVSEQGRKDVILIKPQETVRFITRFEDFANDPVPYMMHCHMLVHEDDGMMLQFEVVDETTGIYEQHVSEKTFVVYPNPVISGNLTVKNNSDTENGNCELYSLSGNKILQDIHITAGNEVKIDVSEIPKGFYFLRMTAGSSVYTKKVIIK